MKKIFPPINSSTGLGYALAILIVIRAFFNGVIPLMDKTEARYSEIARLMAETSDWVMLQIDYGIPFWAKPPLSTWLSAASISVFGVNEFMVRLPYLLICVILVLWMGRYRKNTQMSFFLPGLILFSLPEFFLHAGVVSTDTLLTFSCALVMLSFWEGIQENAKSYWGYLLFVGMGLGLLAKGPIVGILTVPPILLWCALSPFKWKTLGRFPIVIGTLISLGIALPWYIIAELHSPGFVDYFIVGEHFKRFLDSSWQGDKYGFPKQQPMGMIWLFIVGATLPWFLALIRKLIRNFSSLISDPWAFYLLVWFLWTPLFFSISKSLIHPYTLPVMIPFTLLIIHYWDDKRTSLKTTLILSCSLPLIVSLIYVSGEIEETFQNNSDKYLIEKITEEKYSLYSLNEKTYSSQFYSKGKSTVITLEELKQKMTQNTTFYLITENKFYRDLPESTQKELSLIKQTKKRGLYRWITPR